jgi:hypothetical protein
MPNFRGALLKTSSLLIAFLYRASKGNKRSIYCSSMLHGAPETTGDISRRRRQTSATNASTQLDQNKTHQNTNTNPERNQLKKNTVTTIMPRLETSPICIAPFKTPASMGVETENLLTGQSRTNANHQQLPPHLSTSKSKAVTGAISLQHMLAKCGMSVSNSWHQLHICAWPSR